MHCRPDRANLVVIFTKFDRKAFCLKEIEIHTIATSNPPPKARPSIAATEGFLAANNQSIIRCENPISVGRMKL